MDTLDNFILREGREDGNEGPSRQTAAVEDVEDVDEIGTRRRTLRSPIFQQFIWLVDRTYECIICKEKFPNTEHGRIKRPADGSTYPFWMHYKRLHRRIHDALKGKDNPTKQTHLVENREGRMEVKKPTETVWRGLNAEDTNDYIARFVCGTDAPWSVVEHETFRAMWRYATQSHLDPPTAKVRHLEIFISSFTRDI